MKAREGVIQQVPFAPRQGRLVARHADTAPARHHEADEARQSLRSRVQPRLSSTYV